MAPSLLSQVIQADAMLRLQGVRPKELRVSPEIAQQLCDEMRIPRLTHVIGIPVRITAERT